MEVVCKYIMRDAPYFRALDDGFTVHSGWYKVKTSKGLTGYTSGKINRDGILPVFLPRHHSRRCIVQPISIQGTGDTIIDALANAPIEYL